MSGIHTSTGGMLARDGLKTAIETALTADDAVDVYAAFQWPATQPDWVALGSVTVNADPKTIGPRMQRDETITLTVNIGSWRVGKGDAVALAAYERAFALLVAISDHITANDKTLGGAVQWCVPGDVDADGEEFEGGYQVEVAATFVCTHRVRAA
tara:strand:- start:4388 stop:4852 length:465 start_codon:yes stop_codon:yes gene_type:complete